jgi:uncharacterized protein
MQKHNGSLLHSASDLVAFLGCEHSITLALKHLETPLPRAADDASAQLVMEKGMAHERAVLAAYEAQGTVVEIDESGDPVALAAQTLAAMRAGAPIIYQGTLLRAPLHGRTDFLRRVPKPSAMGGHSYEVLDTKLALSPKAKFAVQLAFYSDLLQGAQGVAPDAMHVILGDGREASLHVAEYDHYVGQVRERFLQFVETRPATRPERIAACGTCPWRDVCNAQWDEEDHLNRVAGIRREQIRKLDAAGIATLAQLATSPDVAVPRMAADAVRKLAAQAALQASRRAAGTPKYELLANDAGSGRGFDRMPAPSPGDIFFDMEGDPFEAGGLEYLFGVQYDDGAGPLFKAFWAHDRQAERRAFEAFIDFVVERARQYPDLHIYHYSHYEPQALKDLMTLHGTREAELDHLLRGEKFVDLYKVVRESLRTSEPGLSIKDLEVFYMPPRTGVIQDAGGSIVHYEAWKQTQAQSELDLIAAYNADDCRSTQLLREWLLTLRPANLAWFEPRRDEDEEKARAKSERVQQIEATLAGYGAKLLAGVPEDVGLRSEEEHVRVLLTALLDFHRRAAKPEYWALYARRDATDDELVEDLECLGMLERTDTPPQLVAKSRVVEYAFPEQETKLRAGKEVVRCDTAARLGTIVSLDEVAGRVAIKIGNNREAPARLSIGPGGPINTDALRDAVWRVADAEIAGEASRFRAARAFLRRAVPRLRGRVPGTPIVAGVQDLEAEALRAVEALDESHLFIQGPPGAGKTTIGSHLIVELLRAGKRVGVTSNSHKVIHNLLDAVEKRAQAAQVAFRGVKKSSSMDIDSTYESEHIESVGTNEDAIGADAQLLAGTAWLFADPVLEGRIDYLFVDEAGQVSLANLMAVATSARNLVLLGDHMQLGQPIQGKHPGQSGASALEYLLDGRATVAADRGIFLATSYRMHEDVCRFISDAVYDGRLHAHAANQQRRLVLDQHAHPALRPTGIRFVPVTHAECKQRCSSEADALKSIVARLLHQRWVDKGGSERPITLDDILVVAPYNAQVNLLKETLPQGARVGTIDKFQGQEAAVVLVSMTSSSGADLPRNIEFLYDRNRLNVAVSRAKCLAVVLASPALLHIDCNTPEQMALVNTLCWVRDYANGLPPFELACAASRPVACADG